MAAGPGGEMALCRAFLFSGSWKECRFRFTSARIADLRLPQDACLKGEKAAEPTGSWCDDHGVGSGAMAGIHHGYSDQDNGHQNGHQKS